jgi:hypothetical protein
MWMWQAVDAAGGEEGRRRDRDVVLAAPCHMEWSPDRGGAEVVSDEHRPARWSGSGKRSVQAKGTKPAQPEPVEPPETGTSIEVEQPTEEQTYTPVFKAPAKLGD